MGGIVAGERACVQGERIERLPWWMRVEEEKTRTVQGYSVVRVIVVRLYIRWWAFPVLFLLDAYENGLLGLADLPETLVALAMAWRRFVQERPVVQQYCRMERCSGSQ